MQNLVLGTALCVLFFFSVFQFHHDFPIVILDEQIYMLILAISVAWHLPKKYAALVLGLGITSTAILTEFIDPYSTLYNYRIAFAGWILLLAYAVYRAAGLTFSLILAAFLAFGYIGHLLSGPLQAVQNNPISLTEILMFDNTAMLGISMSIMAGTVSIFIILSSILKDSNIIDIVTNKLVERLGRTKGGAAKVSVAASCSLGSISGATVANVITTGTITIPMMIKAGLKRYQAAAIESVSSTTSQVLPPVMGAAAFMMASLTSTSYMDIALAATIPGILLVVSLMLIAHFVPTSPVDVNLDKPQLRMPNIKNVIWDVSTQSTQLMLLAGVIGIIIGVMDQTGLSFKLSDMLLQFSELYGLNLLVVTALACIILGFGMPTAAAYLVVGLLVAPSLVEAGYNIIASHLFVLYWSSLAMITPPVALGSFTAAKIADADQYKTGYWALLFAVPFMVIPFLFMYFPQMLL